MRSKRSAGILIVILALLMFSLCYAEGNSLGYGTIIKNAVNVRSGPSLQDARITRLMSGSVVKVLSEYQNGNTLWYEVEVDGIIHGYIRGDMIKLARPVATATAIPTATPTPAPTAAPTPDPMAAIMDAEEAVNEEHTPVQVVARINEKQRIGQYTGEMLNGVPHGQGVFVSIDDFEPLTYSGNWENGELRGSGYLMADGFLVHMETTAEGKFDKTGRYVGDVKDGLPHGNGRFDTVNKEGIAWYYEGEWKDGKQHGQGAQVWKEINQGFVGEFRNSEYIPDFTSVLEYASGAENTSFHYNSDTDEFVSEHLDDYFAIGKQVVPSDRDVNWSFDLPQFKKRPMDQDHKMIYVYNLKVVQVNTWRFQGSEYERMIFEDDDGTLYYGFHFGPSRIVDDMRVEGYILPLDYSTYPNVEDRAMWAIFCAIGNNIDVSIMPLGQGDRGAEVLAMKQRLQELGYFTAGAALSNAYNGTCVERVKQFQANNGLDVTGYADSLTLRKLYSSDAVRN